MDPSYVDAYPTLYREHWWWRAREAILLDAIRRVIAGRDRPRILDVGCGAGLFFDALATMGEVAGIESDPAAVGASGRWRDRITLGVLDDSYRPSHQFDVVLLLDVLEHVANPGGILEQAGRVLCQDGALIVTVPAFNWLWTTHDDLNGHVRRYSRRDLTLELQQAGFRVLQAKYLFQSLVAGKLLQRVQERVTRARPKVPRLPPASVSRLLERWLIAENRFAGWLPFGTSVLALATRRR